MISEGTVHTSKKALENGSRKAEKEWSTGRKLGTDFRILHKISIDIKPIL